MLPYEQIQKYVHEALDEFARNDAHLVEQNSSERSMTHMLGVYLFALFQKHGLNVDCEFSRHGSEVKRVGLKVESTDSAETVAKTVFPDIIVHKRGKDGPNLLIIEAKKSGNNVEHDTIKLKAYLRPNNSGLGLGYELGLLLVIPPEVDRPWQVTWYSKGESENLAPYEHGWYRKN